MTTPGRRRVAMLLAGAAACGCLPSSAAAATPELFSRASGENGERANAGSWNPSISADGRYVAFESYATNLDPADTDEYPDIFVRDLVTDTTVLVSRPTDPEAPKRPVHSFDPSISADGELSDRRRA